MFLSIAGNLYQALEVSHRILFLSAKNNFYNPMMWGNYLLGMSHLHLFELEKPLDHFTVVVDNSYANKMHTRVVIDAYVGIALVHCFLNQQEKALEVSEQLLEFSKQIHGAYNPHLVSVARSCQTPDSDWVKCNPGSSRGVII